jgi:glutathione S-transferase
MELWFNPGSPFARKVRILLREKMLLSQVNEISTTVSPVAVNEDLARRNPLVKIPMLVLDDGETLYDSRVICEYLDNLHGSSKSLPELGPLRYAALRRQALADGICDAAVLCRYEQAVRPEPLRWTAWIDGQMEKIHGSLDMLEAESSGWTDDFDVGQMATVAALGYLDFRFDSLAWRPTHPRLDEWSRLMAKRSSVAETNPF